MRSRIKGSIFAKTFLSFATILMFTSMLIYGIAMVATPQSYKAQINEQFTSQVDQLIEHLQSVPRKEADAIIVNFCIDTQAAVSLQGNNDTLVFGDSAIFQQSNTNGVGATQTTASILTFTDTDIPYTIMTAQPLKSVNEMSEAFLKLLPWIMLTIFIISTAGSFICSWMLAKPVQEISRISKRMSSLDMTWRCDIRRSDELGVLAGSLNTMAQKLSAAMNELETANHQLQIDIEKERKQETQRRAFFAAVSHELKTPITILKGQIESMIYGIGAYKNKEKYLPQSLDTVERMENLVKEILTISRLNADGFELTKEPVDLRHLLQDNINTYQPLAEKKDITIHSMMNDAVVCDIDRKLFGKVISNIMSNAILYSPSNEKVIITLTHQTLCIENTGIHIPDDKINELFSPMTRLEESRNKQSGGSGLGLYIVKTIVDLHHLSCEIANTEHGIRFTIYLKQNQN